MSIRARYDPQEDRMRLEIHPEGGGASAFWLTRRQWMNLIRAVGATEFTPRQVPLQPPGGQGDGEETPPQRVRTLRLKREEGGVRVVFQLEASRAGVLLPEQGLPEIGEMFFRQAERAGWDPAAALERLQAGEMAQETLRKARAN